MSKVKSYLLKVLFLALIVSFSAVLFLGTPKKSALAEDTTPATNVFEMVGGAEIRYGTAQNGLRFIVKMSEDIKTQATAEGATLGFIISYTENFDAISDGKYINVSPRLNTANAIISADKIYAKDDGYFYANAVITAMEEAQLNKDWSAIAYINDDAGYKYATNVSDSRSWQYTASCAFMQDAPFRNYITNKEAMAETDYKTFGTNALPVLVAERGNLNSYAKFVSLINEDSTFEGINFKVKIMGTEYQSGVITTDTPLPSIFAGTFDYSDGGYYVIDSIEDKIVTFENGYNPVALVGGSTAGDFSIIESELEAGNHVYGSTNFTAHNGSFLLDRQYLDIVFADQTVEKLFIDAYSDQTVTRYGFQPFNNQGGSEGSVTSIDVGKNGSFVVEYTRTDYEAMGTFPYSQLRMLLGTKQDRMYYDNIRPVVTGASVVTADYDKADGEGYEITASDIAYVTVNGKAFSDYSTTATGILIANDKLAIGTNKIEVYNNSGIIASHTVSVISLTIDFEDGLANPYIYPLNSSTLPLTVLQDSGNKLNGSKVYGLAESKMIYNPQLNIKQAYLDKVFEDESIDALAFEVYITTANSNGAIRMGYYNGTSTYTTTGTTQFVKTAGVHTVMFSRALYNDYKTATSTGGYDLSIRIYMASETGSDFVYFDNFRPYDADKIPTTIDFEDGINTYIGPVINDRLALNIINDNGNRVLGQSTQTLNNFNICISTAYLAEVFKDENVTAVAFDVKAGATVEFGQAGFLGGVTALDGFKLNDWNTYQITRADYQWMVNNEKVDADYYIRFRGGVVNGGWETFSFFYLDNFRPVTA